MIVNNSTYSEIEANMAAAIEANMAAADAATRGSKWDTLQARVTPDEKVDIYKHCKLVVQLPYSVITRLIWRRIISQYRIMPAVQHDSLTEINRATDDVMLCIPVVRQQRQRDPSNF